MKQQLVHFGMSTDNPCEPVPVPENGSLEEKVIATLRNIYDPEIPVNIYDLGLIYRIDIGQDRHALIDMTLTAPNCPVAGSLPAQVECAVRDLDGIDSVSVQLVWDPPWDMSRVSDEVKLALGLL